MSEFMEIPASKKSIAFRRLVCGVGINDADYMVCPKINGKNSFCPYYRAWASMIDRSYNPRLHERFSTYKGCSVANEWLHFSSFKKWMERQDWKGLFLDKDILIPGNKVYSTDTCVFVINKINLLLTDHRSKRGKYPQGVAFHKNSGKYVASCRVNGKAKHLGYFASCAHAELAYLEFKSSLIGLIARNEGGRVEKGLLRHAETLKQKARKVASQANTKKRICLGKEAKSFN